MVLCRKEFAEHVDKGCPLVQGGPLPHVMAAKAVALKEAERTRVQGLRTADRRERVGTGRPLRGRGYAGAHRRD